MSSDHPVHEPGVFSLDFGRRDVLMALAGIGVIRQQDVAPAAQGQVLTAYREPRATALEQRDPLHDLILLVLRARQQALLQ